VGITQTTRVGKGLALVAAVAIAVIVSLVLTAPSALARSGKPTVGCWDYTKNRAVHKVRPNSCALVVSLRACNGACAADQLFIDDCNWGGWGRRHAQGHCTERANGGYHKRHFVKFRRVRHGRFTRGRIGGLHFHLRK
jgi:hypothetical protein